jgi:hypothetical protein
LFNGREKVLDLLEAGRARGCQRNRVAATVLRRPAPLHEIVGLQFVQQRDDVNPAMADLKPLAAESLSRALAAIDELWSADENAA